MTDTFTIRITNDGLPTIDGWNASPLAIEKAIDIVQQVETDGRVTYRLPSPRKIQLTSEIAEALEDVAKRGLR